MYKKKSLASFKNIVNYNNQYFRFIKGIQALKLTKK